MAWRSREKANNILVRVKRKRYNELLRLSSRSNDTSLFAHGTLKIIYNSGRLIVTINSLEDTGGRRRRKKRRRWSFIPRFTRNYIDPLLNNEYLIGNKSVPIFLIFCHRQIVQIFFLNTNLFARDTTGVFRQWARIFFLSLIFFNSLNVFYGVFINR